MFCWQHSPFLQARELRDRHLFLIYPPSKRKRGDLLSHAMMCARRWLSTVPFHFLLRDFRVCASVIDHKTSSLTIILRSEGECAGYSRRGPFHIMERLRFPFTPNGRREFVKRDQVFPLFSINSLLLLHKKISSFMPLLTIGIVRDWFYGFICLFSILRNSQLESGVCRLRWTWILISLITNSKSSCHFHEVLINHIYTAKGASTRSMMVNLCN